MAIVLIEETTPNVLGQSHRIEKFCNKPLGVARTDERVSSQTQKRKMKSCLTPSLLSSATPYSDPQGSNFHSKLHNSRRRSSRRSTVGRCCRTLVSHSLQVYSAHAFAIGPRLLRPTCEVVDGRALARESGVVERLCDEEAPGRPAAGGGGPPRGP